MSADKTEIKEESSKSALAEPEYVVVSASSNDEPIELPTNPEDNTLGLTTLSHAFPNAHGLKYKNPKTGASRALLIDSTGTKFCAPPGGWEGKVFNVIFQTEPSKRLMPGEQNPKRKKMMDDSVSSGSEDGDGNLHGVTKLQRLNKEEENDKYSNERTTEKGVCSDLLILGLPFSLSEDEMKEYFSKFGKVTFVEIKKNSAGESRGFGFVRMSKMSEQETVLSSGHTIGGRKCHVKYPVSKSGDAKETRTPDNVRLFVGKLTDKISARRLKEFFGIEARKIDSGTIITDAYIPTPFRGFGFINLSSTLVAKELLKKDTFVIDDITITLSIASPKQPTPSQFPSFDSQAPQSSYGAYDRRAGYFAGQDQQFNEPWDHNYRGQNRYHNEFYEANPYEFEGPYQGNSISSGLETLNLNMKPDVMDAALKAFWSAASRNNSGNPHYNQPPPQQHGRPSGYSRRGPASSPSTRWR